MAKELEELIPLAPAGTVDLTDAGELLGVSGRTVRRWIEDGKVAGVKQEWPIGSEGWRWVVPLSEIDRLKEEVPG